MSFYFCFACIVLFSLNGRYVYLNYLFARQENSSPQRISDLSKVSQLLSVRTNTQTLVLSSPKQLN